MQSLSAELKQVIVRRLESAKSSEILEIASQLCEAEEPLEFSFKAQPMFRFIKADELVEDVTTGLIWTAADVGERHTWAEAEKAAAGLTLGGFKDWRLPTVKELLTLVDYSRHSPAIDTALFPACKSDWYWSSTPYASSPGDYAWYVGFYNGGSYYCNQDDKGLVRAVRARQ